MAQVHRPLQILLDAEMNRLDAHIAGIIARILREHEAYPPEAQLVIEDALIADGRLDGDIGDTGPVAIELGGRDVGQA